nr:hypothetical protein [Tanacetum cinerariifolium]
MILIFQLTNAKFEFLIENERGVMISAKEDSLCAALKTDTVKPLNFLVKKVNHPDVTLIDLPKTRRACTAFIKEFISTKDMVLVHVVSSENCFAQGFISSNQEIAKRSLVVFTKVDKLIRKSAENLKLKLNLDNVGDRFICVRNLVGKENLKTAIDAETKLFAEDNVFSCIDKKNVGLTTLASKVDVYISTISNTLGRILQDIDDDISTSLQDVAKLEKPSVSRILKLTENNLRVSFLSRDFVDIEAPAKYASNHLYLILENFFNGLTKTAREHIAKKDPEGKFLMYELTLLGSKTSLASFSKPLGSMYSSIRKQSYDIIPKRITSLEKEVMDFVDGYVTAVLAAEANYYPKLFVLLLAAGNKLTKKLRGNSKVTRFNFFNLRRMLT